MSAPSSLVCPQYSLDMDDGDPLVFKHKDVPEKLGDREPSTEFEAQAVLEGTQGFKRLFRRRNFARRRQDARKQ
jgi:hypothetical protein